METKRNSSMLTLIDICIFIAAVLALVFFKNLPFLLIVGIVVFINAFIQTLFNGQHGVKEEIAAVVISVIVSFFSSVPWYYLAAICLCAAKVITHAFGILILTVTFIASLVSKDEE